MISKAHNNGSFKATIGYLLGKEGALVLDYGGLTESTTIPQKVREMALTALESRRAKKPVYHLSLSVSPEDRGKLTDDDFRHIAHEYLKQLGLNKNQFLLVKHTDTAHEHVHLVVNRVKDGKAVSNSKDHYKLVAFDRQIEQQYGLVIAPKDLRQEHEQKKGRETDKGRNKPKVVKLPCEMNQPKEPPPQSQKKPEPELSNPQKLEAWKQNAAEAVKLAERIEECKKARKPVPLDLWVEMREQATKRDKAAEACLQSPELVEEIKKADPSLLKRITRHARRAKIEALERAPHYINRFKRWLFSAREHFALLTTLETKQGSTTKEERLRLSDLFRKRNASAHDLAEDKTQFAQVSDPYKNSIRNQNLDYEQRQKAQQLEQAQEHARRLERGLDLGLEP